MMGNPRRTIMRITAPGMIKTYFLGRRVADFLAVTFLAGDFLADAFFATAVLVAVFFTAAFFAGDFFAAAFLAGARGLYAQASISTAPPNGSAATPIVERAGRAPSKPAT